MVRDLTTSTIAQAQTSGSEPLIIVEIDWEGSANKVQYADKDIFEGGITAEGKISKMGAIRSAIGPRQLGSTTATRITLLDDDESIKTILKSHRAEDKTVRIFQYFGGLTSSDLTVLVKGKVGSPVFYNEQEREFSFTVIGAINSKPVGDTLENPQVNNPESTKGKSWPVCFGHVKDVPALLYKKYPKASIREKLGLFAGNVKVEVLDTDKTAQEVYPAGAETWIIGGEIVSGGFGPLTGENRFLFIGIPSRNINRYSFSTGPRPAGDEDRFNPHVLYMSFFSDIVNGNINVTDHWVTVGGVKNYCIGQEGTKLFFQNPFSILVPGNFTCTVRKYEPEEKTQFDGNGNQIGTYINGHILEPGTTMELYNNDLSSHDYIVNQLQTTEIKEIKAFRRVGTFREPQLVCIPEDYYETEFTTIEEGKTATIVKFKIPLSQRDEGWVNENIYVTMQSSVGRNTADQIKYILENFTDLEIDVESFDSVRNSVTNFPSDFAILNGEDALQICNDIAWQSRCALYTVGNKAFIKFLASNPVGTEIQNVSITADITDEDNSFVLSSTAIEQLVTVLILTWRSSYAEEAIEARFSVNTVSFGERKDFREIFIYQNETYVQKTGDFWIQRLGRLWRIISGKVFLDALPVELLDYVEVNYPDLVTPASVVGQVITTEHDTNSNVIGLDVWLPVEVGTEVVSGSAYQSGFGSFPSDPLANIEDCTVEKYFIGRKPEFLIGKRDAVRTAAPGVIDSVISSIAGGAGGGGTSASYMVRVHPNGITSLPTELVMVTDITPDSTLEAGDSTIVFQTESGQYFIESPAAASTEDLVDAAITQEMYPFKAYEHVDIPGTTIGLSAVQHWTWMMQGEILFKEAAGFAQDFVQRYMVRVYLDGPVQWLTGSGRGRTRFVDVRAKQFPQDVTEELPSNTVVWVMAIKLNDADYGQDSEFVFDGWTFNIMSPTFLV